ncbi:galactokinase [soil metagenome]
MPSVASGTGRIGVVNTAPHVDNECSAVVAQAPGRVNLMGDHTDYTGGLVLPAAIDRYVEIAGQPGGDEVVLRSDQFDGVARLPVGIGRADVGSIEPSWARLVAAVVVELQPSHGFVCTVTSSVPAGAGLSSSAALELAVAVALGADTADPVALAQRAQRAEHLARGVPTGIMDQLACTAGRAGHALLIDCEALTHVPIPLPDDVEIVVFHSGQARDLAASAYAERVAECAAAAAVIGPLRTARAADVERLHDDLLRRRARHVVTENARVRATVAALEDDDGVAVGRLMGDSHASLRDDYEVSTPAVDELVARLAASDGVLGARLTGAGFGGCVVALVRPGTELEGGWPLRAVDGVGRQ